ncbi:hypothetical protein [Duganella vulcania]|uniref:Uncharacterized protein n=1 Tax=Duganella vulcania TaxID=2692166 RepID=A0A845GIG4_9BURK|nr:hypothetical protein [Duganella vulcania]MYM92459.1 hypothetical protein [Duganella vulcania]
MSDTKAVRITLAALTRVEYTELLQVPASMTSDQLDDLVRQRYQDVDGGLYYDDPHYWERSPSCQWADASAEDQTPSGAVTVSEHGALVITQIA